MARYLQLEAAIIQAEFYMRYVFRMLHCIELNKTEWHL